MNTLTTLFPANTRRFFYQLGKSSHSLGIDVGQVNTKIVIAERNAGGEITYRGVSIPSSPEHTNAEDPVVGSEDCQDATHNSQPPSSQTLNWSTRSIKQLVSRVSQVVGGNSRAHSLEVGVTLSMSACDYRTLYVPKNSRVSSVGVEQSIAAAMGDNRSRCVALVPGHETQADTRQTKLRCFSLAEDLAWSVAQQLDGAGLIPSSLNGLPWCIANALEMAAPPEDTPRMHVGIDWSHGEPTLVSIKQGTIDYVRCLTTGSLRELMSPVMTQFGMTPFEAGRWLAHCLHAPETQQTDAIATESRDWVREACTKLAAEIEVAIEFIKWRNQGFKLETIWLMGGATRISGLAELLQSMLPCSLRLWSAAGESHNLSADYAMAASLAWMGLRHA